MKATFLRELRAGLVPDALVLLLALGAFVAVERAIVIGGGLSGDARQVIDLILLGVATLMSFASGARTFPVGVKTRHLLLLYTMPISRGALWCALIGGRFSAVTIALSSLLLVRPSILRTLGQPDPTFGALSLWLLVLVPVLFAAGACSALVFEGTLAVYLIGCPITILSVFQALGFANMGFSPWRPNDFAVWLWAPAIASIFLTFLLFSWWFFRWGDFTARRRSLVKQALFAIALLSVLGMVGTVTSSPLLADLFKPSSRGWFRFPERLVSPGGLYLAVTERLTRRPGLSRLAIVETATGRVLAAQMWRDIQWASWSGQDQVLHLFVRDYKALEPWGSLLGEPQTTWIRLSPEGRELSRFRFEATQGIAPLPDGTDLVISHVDGKTQILCLQNQSTPSVLAEIPSSRGWSLAPFGRRGAILFGEPPEVWGVRDRIARMGTPQSVFVSSRQEIPQTSVQSILTKAFGRPGPPGVAARTSGTFLGPIVLDSSPLSPVAFFEQQDGATLSLWTRSLKATGWERRATGLAPSNNLKQRSSSRPLGLSFVRYDQRPSISVLESLVAYLPTGGGDGRASLYDGELDREIALPTCESGRAAFPELVPAQSGPAFLVLFQCRTPASLRARIRVRIFYYLPGSGRVKLLPDLAPVIGRRPILLVYLDETTAIWRSEDTEAWQMLRNGKLRTLWPGRH